MIVSVTSTLDGSIPGSLDWRSSSSARASSLLRDSENCLDASDIRVEDGVNVAFVRLRAQGVRNSRGSDMVCISVTAEGRPEREERENKGRQ